MMIPANNHIILTGKWPSKKTAADFFKAFGIDAGEDEAFQLFQTWSECRIEKFNETKPLDDAMIDQYRAFCPDWELWVRNINAKELRFRFIGTDSFTTTNFAGSEFEFNEEKHIKNCRIESATYPLWGESLNNKNGFAGWYTQIIPQLLDYPVDTMWEKVALEALNFVRPDGTVDMVRYCSIVKFNIHETI